MPVALAVPELFVGAVMVALVLVVVVVVVVLVPVVAFVEGTTVAGGGAG